MADRQEFLGQIQQQLTAWTHWLRDLEEQALKNARHLRADAEAAYRLRAEHVRDLIRQGRVQLELVSEAGDAAWATIAGNTEQTWTTLQDIAATLAMQSTPAANEATAEAPAKRQSKARKSALKVVARRKSAVRSRSRPAAKKRATSKKAKAARTKSRKQAPHAKAAGARKKPKKATSKRPGSKRKTSKAGGRKSARRKK